MRRPVLGSASDWPSGSFGHITPTLLVGLQRVPHVQLDVGQVLDAPERVVGPLEGALLERRHAATRVVGLERTVVGHARRAQRLRLVGHRVHGVRRGGHHHDVDAVVGDEVAGHRGGAVGVGLRVLDDDLDGMRLAVAALDAALDGGVPLVDAELVGLAERGQRAGQRRDEADLDRAAGAGAAAAAAIVAAAAGGDGAAHGAAQANGGAGDPSHLEEVAPAELVVPISHPHSLPGTESPFRRWLQHVGRVISRCGQ